MGEASKVNTGCSLSLSLSLYLSLSLSSLFLIYHLLIPPLSASLSQCRTTSAAQGARRRYGARRSLQRTATLDRAPHPTAAFAAAFAAFPSGACWSPSGQARNRLNIFRQNRRGTRPVPCRFVAERPGPFTGQAEAGSHILPRSCGPLSTPALPPSRPSIQPTLRPAASRGPTPTRLRCPGPTSRGGGPPGPCGVKSIEFGGGL